MAYFKDDDDFTQQGTKEILDYYNNDFEFVDLQKDAWFQKFDIDFIFKQKDNSNICKVEIKCDSYPDKNIFLETVSNNNKNTLGCMLLTQSDCIFYYYANWKKLYIFDTESLQGWLKKNKDSERFKIAHPATKDKYGNVYYYGTGLVVPLDTFLQELGKNNYKIRKLV